MKKRQQKNSNVKKLKLDVFDVLKAFKKVFSCLLCSTKHCIQDKKLQVFVILQNPFPLLPSKLENHLSWVNWRSFSVVRRLRTPSEFFGYIYYYCEEGDSMQWLVKYNFHLFLGATVKTRQKKRERNFELVFCWFSLMFDIFQLCHIRVSVIFLAISVYETFIKLGHQSE